MTICKLHCVLVYIAYSYFLLFPLADSSLSVVKSWTEPVTSGCVSEIDVSLSRGDLPSVESKQILPAGVMSVVIVTGTKAQIYTGSLCLDSWAFDYVSMKSKQLQNPSCAELWTNQAFAVGCSTLYLQYKSRCVLPIFSSLLRRKQKGKLSEK